MVPKHYQDEQNSTLAGVSPMVVLVAGTVIVVFVAIVVFIILWKKTKLNWYEKNLLELAKEDKQIIRYNQKDEDDDDETRASSYSLYRKEKRKTQEKASSVDSEHNDLSPTQYGRLYGSMPSLDNVSIGSLDVKEKRVQPADVSDKFFVPKSHVTETCSMFRGLDMNKIDKDLYDSSRHDCYPTEDPVLGQCGSIQMALCYDTNLNLLRITLLQASNLTARKSSNFPNPHFKVTLFPPEGDSAKQSYQSKIYKNQRSPKLNDEFCFDISSGHVGQHNLQILVYDFDQYSVDECIGCCWLCLNRVDISTDHSVKTVFWLEVMPMENENENIAGEILFSLSYLSKAQRLIVNVMEARNLVVPEDLTDPPDSCVKVSIICNGKRIKHKRTSVKKATYNPNFTESLTFNIPKASLCDVTLSMSVYHEPHAFRSGKMIGRFEIPLNKCKELWKAVIRGEDSKPKWYPLEKA